MLNRKITHQFSLVLGTVLLGIMVLFSSFTYRTANIHTRLQQITHETLSVIGLLNDIRDTSTAIATRFALHPAPDNKHIADHHQSGHPPQTQPDANAQLRALLSEYSRTVDAFFPGESRFRDHIVGHARELLDLADRLPPNGTAIPPGLHDELAAVHMALSQAISEAIRHEDTEIDERMANLESAVSQSSLAVWLGIIGLTGLIALGALYVVRHILRRIEALRAAAGKIGDADLSVRVADDSPDELGDLARTFNAMADQLADMIKHRDVAERQLRDLNDRLESLVKSRTDEYRRAKDEAENANAVKSKFLSSMSHELRTPLNAIMGFSQMLRMYDFPEDHRDEYINIIIDNCRILLSEISQLLVLSKLSDADLNLARYPVPLDQAIDACIAQSTHLAREYKVRIKNETARKPLPKVWAEEEHLNTILGNLMTNAIKYNRPEDGQVIIRNQAISDSTHRIIIEDTGQGFREDYPGQVLEPFERLHNYGGAIDGCGVGLTIANSFLANINGKLGYESSADSGTRFWVDLEVVPEMA